MKLDCPPSLRRRHFVVRERKLPLLSWDGRILVALVLLFEGAYAGWRLP